MKLSNFIFFLSLLYFHISHAQIHYLHIENEDVENKYADGTQIVENALIKYFIANPQFSIVERKAIDIIEKERMTQRKESFMEGHFVSQNKAVGASYLVVYLFNPFKSELQIKFLNLTTNEVLYKEILGLNRFLNKSNKIDRPDYFERYVAEVCNDVTKGLYLVSNEKIKLMDIVLQKKDKVEQVLIACENSCILKSGAEFTLIIKEASKVKGVFIDKKIGRIKLSKIHAANSATAQVIEGQMDIIKHINLNNEILCEIR